MASMLGERESLVGLIDSLKHAEAYARSLSYHRGDLRWTKVATALNKAQQQVTELAMRGVRTG